MQTQTIHIHVPRTLLQQLQSKIPNKKRSAFIVDAIREKLVFKKDIQKKLHNSLQENREFYKKEYKDWENTEIEGWSTKVNRFDE